MFISLISGLGIMVRGNTSNHTREVKKLPDVSIKSDAFECTTTMKEMRQLFECRGIKVFSNFKYKFSVGFLFVLLFRLRSSSK